MPYPKSSHPTIQREYFRVLLSLVGVQIKARFEVGIACIVCIRRKELEPKALYCLVPYR